MDDYRKALRKFSEKERLWSAELIRKILEGDTRGLDIKKLKGSRNVLRIRRGDIRIIYSKRDSEITILEIGRKHEKTY